MTAPVIGTGHGTDPSVRFSAVVPAGVPHTYEAIEARYLIILTPRLAALISELQQTRDRSAHPAVYQKHDSELLEP